MAVTGVPAVVPDPVAAQVDRIAASEVLRGSEALCRLLRYLAHQATIQPGVSIKEYQIATEVFGRPSKFDSRLDSTVRVQTSRLRAKLLDYYAGEGHGDALILEVPKGSYSLSARARVVTAPPPIPEETSLRPAEPAAFPARLRIALWVLILATTATVATLTTLWVTQRKPPQPQSVKAPAELSAFWAPFIDSQDRPLVVFSNAEFIGHPTKVLRYYDPVRDADAQIVDYYTGVGEVLAIHELDRVFSTLHSSLRVKRGRLLTFDDARNSDLIFLGSPSENLALREIPTTQNFVFRRIEQGPRAGDIEIVNVRPAPGEPATFKNSAGMPAPDDYALIGLVPALNADRWALILAGTTTMGTLAASEFVSSESSLRDLLRRLERGNGQARPFEAVIKVKISGGVPVRSELVAVHPR